LSAILELWFPFCGFIRFYANHNSKIAEEMKS